MTSRLRSVAAATRLSVRRLRSTWMLTLGVVIAMAALVGVWVGIPLYAESASSRLLSEQVGEAEADNKPFGYLFSWNRLSGGNQSWAALGPVNEYLDGDSTPFGSTVNASVRFVQTLPFDLYVPGDLTGEDAEALRLDRLTLTSLRSPDSVDVVGGRLAQPVTDPGQPIEVMATDEVASDLGVSVGQSIVIVNQRADAGSVGWATDAVLTGIWAAPDLVASAGEAAAHDRFVRSSTMQSGLVIPEETMATVIDGLAANVLSSAQWLVLLDSDRVTTDNVDGLLAQTDLVNRGVDERLRGSRLLISPASALEGFQEQVDRINVGLRSFSIPTLALVCAVVALLISMAWRRRAREVDLLRSRGISASTIVVAMVIEACLLGLVAAALGALVARLVATFMAQTATFLRLGDGVDLALSFTPRSVAALITSTVLIIILQVVPGVSVLTWSSRADQRRSETRADAPWWQRVYLDVVVIAGVGLFAWFVLRSDSLGGDLLDDPVVILVPAAIAFAGGLVMLRFFPVVMGVAARLLERTSATSALLVARRNARVPGAIAAPLMLLVVTGALAIYTASLARTLDLQLLDRAYHQVGAANSIDDAAGSDRTVFDLVDGRPVRASGATGAVIDTDAYERVWGLDSVTRIAQLTGRVAGIGEGGETPVEFTGIDPATFAETAFWRDDYATVPLPELLARLESTPDGVLAHARILAGAGLRIGDTIGVTVTAADRSAEMDMVIVGGFSQFPTWAPSNQLAPLVANLNDLEQRFGRSVARRVLFDRSTNASAGAGLVDDGQTRADLNRLGIGSASVQSADALIERAQLRPERQGVFGLLTVSFVLSAILTLLGFVLYAASGFRQQSTELGVLRAVGMRLRSLLAIVGLDLLLVASVGLGTAVVLGAGTARFVLPRLIGTSTGTAPVLLQEIDWAATVAITLALLVAFVVVTAVLLGVLRRIRLFEAVKIGADR